MNKGIKYCPDIKEQYSTLVSDSSRICRNLRLTDHHNKNMSRTIENTSIITCKNPSADIVNSYNPVLESCIDNIVDILLIAFKDRTHTSNEHKCAYNLAKKLRKQNYKLCKSDKGGNFIIMPIDDYNKQIYSHLNDDTTYTECNEGVEYDIQKTILNLCKSEKENLTKKEFNYVTAFKWRQSSFYILPKLHKSKIIKDFSVVKTGYTYLTNTPSDLTSRPIVNTTNSVTSHLNELLDSILKPYIFIIPSYIRDSFDFLTKLPKSVDENCIFISWDIVSLYTKIPNTLGIEAVQFWIQNKLHPPRFSDYFIIESLNTILNYNTFYHNKKHFRQIAGVSMGAKISPTYAMLTIAYLELKFYDLCSTHFGTNIGEYIKSNFFRFIDDCFLVWNKTFGDVNIITNILNSLNNSIQYTINQHEQHLPFLDIMIYKKNTEIHTDIYKKPTDSTGLLPFNSKHPRHTIRNIPYNLSRRINLIVSEESIKTNRLNELKTNLLIHGYPINLVNDAVNKKYNFSKNDKNTSKKLPLIFDYNNRFIVTTQQIKRSIESLSNHKATKHILNNNIPILSFKSSPTILDITKHKIPNIRKCNRPRCKTCPMIIQCTTIQLPNRNIILHPNTSINCNSDNVIYTIICNKCNKIYIGQTSTTLCKRMTLHRQHNSHEEYAILSVNKHLNRCNESFKIVPLFKIRSNSTISQLLFIEKYFIRLLKPELNDFT